MLNPRFDALRDYPFQQLRDLLDRHTPPAGLAPINLSIGEPQHPYPDFAGEVLHANRHLYGKYPPAQGTPELREAIVAWLNRRYGLTPGMVDPDRHLVPLAGTREGLFMVAQAAVPESKAGARPLVAMPNPFYQAYAGGALSAGAEMLFLPARAEHDFFPDLDRLDRATLDRIALFYLCSPANPQGTVASLDYLKRLIGLARAHDFTLVFDECYAEIYDRTPPAGALQACAELGGALDNVLVFHSLSKRSSVPGLRAGFCAGDARLVAAFLRIRSYGGAGTPLPVMAAAAALWRDETHVEANRTLYREKFDIAQNIIGNRFGFYRPPGGFFLWLDVGESEQAAEALWRRAAIRALPGKYLARGDDNSVGLPYLRVALVADAATTRTALERMRDVLG